MLRVVVAVITIALPVEVPGKRVCNIACAERLDPQCRPVLQAIPNDLPRLPGDDPYFMPTPEKTSLLQPRVILRNMLQDRQGNIWFATFGGVFRFDGKLFVNYSAKVGLSKTRTFSVIEDRAGNIWFGAFRGGASRFDGKSFTNYSRR